MFQFSTMLSVLVRLVAVARRLANEGVPSAAADGHNNWSATKEAMESFLGRPLTNEEITLLSVSRAFGPTPLLEAEWGTIQRLWPNGNGQGLRYDWKQLTEELITFRDGNDNPVYVHPSGLVGVYIVELCEKPDHGYLAEENGPGAWFGDRQCPSSYEMPCIGWFGPGESWDDAEQGIRSLSGYEVDYHLVSDVIQFQLKWDQGRMDEAEVHASTWHPDAFAAQLWQGVTPQDAWNRAVAALIKLRAVTDDLPVCAEQTRVQDALTAMGVLSDAQLAEIRAFGRGRPFTYDPITRVVTWEDGVEASVWWEDGRLHACQL